MKHDTRISEQTTCLKTLVYEVTTQGIVSPLRDHLTTRLFVDLRISYVL